MSKHIKVYTGSGILVNKLQLMLDEIGVKSIIKDKKESGRLAGFGVLEESVEVFILDSDLEKARKTVEDFKLEVEN
ncbi:putative signal transducing protein [Tenacibaculum geojense]|uniref:Signal transducing protein n=1 Tax=Tenacibaculum geojense TaxID=915352 RepID=A0ABW3JRS1_9FLAO